MQTVRTVELKLTLPPHEAETRIREAIASAGMSLEANDGDAIRASSPFSMKKNRWAAEISIDLEPLADGTLATCRVKTMLGGKHSEILRDILDALGADAFERAPGINCPMIGRLGKKVLEEIHKSCRPEETPTFIVADGAAGALVAFSDRCMIIKKGALTGLMAGSVGGGRVATFMYHDITGIEYNSGWVTGVLEILTPSYQGSANKDYWSGTMKGRNADSNDPWTLSNTLPLPKRLYEQARPHIDHMRQMVADIKRPAAPNGAPTVEDVQLPEQLAKLAELHQSGVLEADEFRQAKQALISKS